MSNKSTTSNRSKNIILITGPSTVGKTTYSIKKYNNNKYCLIDTDVVWFILAKKYKWNRDQINKDLYPTIVDHINNCHKSNKTPVVVDNKYDLLSYVKRDKVKIIVVGAKLDRLVKNFYKRSDKRDISFVLKEWEKFFQPFDRKGKNRFCIKKDDLNNFIIKKKKDKTGIDRFIKKFFGSSKSKSKVWIGVKGEYDQLFVN